MSVSYEEALSHIRNVAATLNSQLLINPVNLPLPQSLGSISTQDVTSNRTLPPLDNSAMDGFAVTSSETLHASHQNPIRLKILGSIAAGDHPISYDENTTPALSCFYINTGAPFPLPSQWQQQDDAFHYEPRFDACLRKEDASISQDGKYVELHKPVNKRQHRRKAGEDFLPGMKIISKYDKITPERIAALSYHGISCIDTIPQPKIAILSTGKELEQLDAFPPNKPPPSHIYDSNSYYLLAALYQWGFTNVERLESLGDDPADFKKTVEECAKRDFELLITTGGVSKGQHDYIESTLKSLGAAIHYHGTRMRPGHPALLATYSPTTPSTKQLSVFGLPGNPCAAAATLRFMVLPFLSIAMGQSVELPSSKARISNVGPQKSIDKTHVSLDIRKGNPADSTTTPVTNGSTACGGASRKAGHRSYLLAQYAGYNDDGLRLVHTLDKGSGMVRPLSTAECWVLLKEGQGEEDDLLVDCYSI